MLASEIRALLGDAPDDSKWGWNLFWKNEFDNPDAEPVFPIDMIKQMELAMWQLDDDDEE